MAAHLKKRVCEKFSKVVQLPQEEAPAKKLRLTKPSKSAALHIDLCKASNPTDALQYLLHFARSSMEAEGVVRILLEHYYKEQDNSVRLKIASLIGLLSKTQNFSPESILDDTLNTFNTEKFHQVLDQLLDTLLVIGTQLPESPTVRHRLIEVACKIKHRCGLQVESLSYLFFIPLSLVPLAHRSRSSLSRSSPPLVPLAHRSRSSLSRSSISLIPLAHPPLSQHLSDTYFGVRNKCMQLLSCLGNVDTPLNKDGQGLVPAVIRGGAPGVSGGVCVRDTQSVISDYSSDQYPRVRTAAIKAMRKRTAHERAKELYASGEFSSGRKWADDASKEKMDTSAVNLIASGGLRSLCSRTGGRDVRDLQRLGKLQTELAGAADFSATYLRCQLLLS